MEPRFNEGSRDWQFLFAIRRFRFIEVLFHIFYYYWGKENRSLYRERRYIEIRYIEVRYIEVRYIEIRYIEVRFIEVRYIEVRYIEVRYIEVRYIEVLFHIFYYYWGKENRSLYRGRRYIETPLYFSLITK